MDEKRRVAAATDRIGEATPADEGVRPAVHAAAVQDVAPALAEILRNSRIASVARLYEQCDRDAVDQQRVFKRAAWRASIATLATAGLSALLLVGPVLASVVSEDVGRWWFVVIGALAILVGGLAATWLYLVQHGNLLELWMKSRADAEARRSEYFRLVTARVEDASSGADDPADDPADDVPLALLQLEYYRRYQLDGQRAWYRRAGERHRESAGKTLRMSAIAAGVASISAGLSALLGSAIDPNLSIIAVFGVLGTAFASLAGTREGVNQDRRNAERYARTATILEELYGLLNDVRAAVAAGHREALDEFVEAVDDQMTLEHREWLADKDERSHAVVRLQKTLDEQRNPVDLRP